MRQSRPINGLYQKSVGDFPTTKKKLRPVAPRATKKEKEIVDERVHARSIRVAAILAAASLIIVVAGFVWLNWRSAPEQAGPEANVDVPRAAILDGLYKTEPDLTLIEDLNNCISSAGYRVDLFQGENVTIDLLRNVCGYKMLVLRLHSSIHTDGFLYIFSGEYYTESKYVNEQLSGSVRKGYTFDESEPPYFALNAVFLGKGRPDGLNGSTIILTGCNGTGKPYVVQRIFEGGAKAYISWNGYVDLSHSDKATLRLVKALCTEKLGLREAVERTMKEVGPDPFYESVLECHIREGT